MTRTLRDCLLEGGAKGKRFVDPNYARFTSTVYEVQEIHMRGSIGASPPVIVQGTIVGTNKPYLNNLNRCLDHEEVE